MTDDQSSDNQMPDEMSAYLQMFLDETEEQLDGLVETLLVLEREPGNVEELNEAFRLIHSIKGSAGMMGFDNLAVLTHHLENRFEAFRSGSEILDNPTMDLVLRCIDFLRECVRRLRAGEALSSAVDLLRELTVKDGEESAAARGAGDAEPTTGTRDSSSAATTAAPASDAPASDDAPDDATVGVDGAPTEANGDPATLRVVVTFEPGLPLVDLKARLILSRLGDLGAVVETVPEASALESIDALERFEIRIRPEATPEAIRDAADLDGVHAVEIDGATVGASTDEAAPDAEEPPPTTDEPEMPAPADVIDPEEVSPVEPSETAPAESDATESSATESVATGSVATESDADESARLDETTPGSTPATAASEEALDPPAAFAGARSRDPVAPPPGGDRARPRIAETMRVDIDRLDRLMNLAGELVVNRARFVQITGQAGASFRARNVVGRVRDFGETLRRTIDDLERLPGTNGEWRTRIEELRSGVEFLEEQSEMWDHGRRCFGQIGEAIDQLTRISDSLQQGVLDTRMVPVAPLLNRFNRVVRDLSTERGKKVNLEILGEKTELDKRMIDELGDPLVHLVRNSIDHGLEPPDVRAARGKPEVGTIRLEASHSGNNVSITISDDGGGIDVDRVRRTIVSRGLRTEAATAELSDQEALDHIWHAGFSTASTITDISGRGVGMDVVRTRITDLNGSIDVDTVAEQGTTFTIRLPLTLAILNSLLIRIRSVIFALPIDDVREIVSVREEEIVDVQGKQTIDVRGEFIPLIGIDDIFEWPDHGVVDNGSIGASSGGPAANGVHAGDSSTDHGAIGVGTGAVAAVILQVADRTMALRVDALLGSQDIVIKSLSENFIHIRGLSGASILGDGTVCLMLDVGTIIDLAVRNARHGSPKGARA